MLRIAAAVVLLSALGVACTVQRETSSAATDAPDVAIEDGRHFGYIRAVDLDARTLRFDVAEFLMGDEADRAAQEDGVIEPGEQIENDYYIINDEETFETVPFSSEVEIRVVGDPPDTVPGELAPFAAGFDKDNVTFDPADPYRGKNTQYWVTVQNGAIVKIEELYLP